MAQRPPLSNAEMEVISVVWELGTATVRQVHEAISKGRKIDFSTVQTYLGRLESKGYLRSRINVRTKTFSARARPSTVINETVEGFIGRLFAGDAMPLMRHLIQERGVNEDEIAELRRMLKQWEDEQDESGH